MNPDSEHVNNEPDRQENKTGAGPALQSSSTLLRVLRLARKELRESLRDRRTLVTLIVMPLIVYPLLGTVVQRFAIQRVNPDSPPAVVVFDGSISAELATAMLEGRAAEKVQSGNGDAPHADSDTENSIPKDAVPSVQDVASSLTGSSTGAAIGSLMSSGDSEGPPIRFRQYESPVKAEYIGEFLQSEDADVGVRQIPAMQDRTTGKIQPGDFQVLSRSGDTFSLRAAVEVEKRLLAFRDRQLRILLDKTRLGSGIMPTISRQSVASNAQKSSPLGAFLPLMLVLMTMTGAVYPAIDLTAGERERGTLEILMAAPVSRAHLLTGKFIAVLTVAVLTAVINLVAMLLTLYATGFDRVILADGATLRMFFQILALLVVFASFFSAVLLSITSFARSFREAQAWLIPLMLVSLAPGILSLMPGVHLTVGLALVPLVNIVLLGRELFQGTAATHLYVVTLLSTLVYTVLALRVAASVFGSDTVLFGSSAGLSAFAKSPGKVRSQIPLEIGIGWLLLLVPLFLVLSGLRARVVALENLSGQLMLSGILTILLFGDSGSYCEMDTCIRRRCLRSAQVSDGDADRSGIARLHNVDDRVSASDFFKGPVAVDGDPEQHKTQGAGRTPDVRNAIPDSHRYTGADPGSLRRIVLSRVSDQCSSEAQSAVGTTAADQHIRLRRLSCDRRSVTDAGTFSRNVPARSGVVRDSILQRQHFSWHRDARADQWIAAVTQRTGSDVSIHRIESAS
ncbi:MAG: ABC transporter permease subunit [Planctomycetaceae bacterium]